MEDLKRCFIIGNGPSQNNVDLSLLADETTFGMNDIRLKFPSFHPTYWVVLDNHYWQQYKKEILDWDSHPCTVLGMGKPEGKPTDRYQRINVYGDRRGLQRGLMDFYPLPSEIFSIGNVGHACMQIAWQKGFRILNLIGFDALEPCPRLGAHFSENYGERLTDPNIRVGRRTLANPMMPVNVWINGYKNAYSYVTRHGGEMWNVSEGEVPHFPKRTLEESLA